MAWQVSLSTFCTIGHACIEKIRIGAANRGTTVYSNFSVCKVDKTICFMCKL